MPKEKFLHTLFITFVLCVLFVSCFPERESNDDNNHNPSKSYSNGNLDETFAQKEPKLSPEEEFKIKRDSLVKEGWEEKDLQDGQLPNCYNFRPTYGNIDNSLDVLVGSGTAVVIKVMNAETQKCIRYVYINSKSSYSIKNIPPGKYYLKIAYGKNWLSKVESGKCIGKFIRNPLYQEGSDIMDFNIINDANGYSIPSFSLQLDVISNNLDNSFESENISEDEFNN